MENGNLIDVRFDAWSRAVLAVNFSQSASLSQFPTGKKAQRKKSARSIGAKSARHHQCENAPSGRSPTTSSFSGVVPNTNEAKQRSHSSSKRILWRPTRVGSVTGVEYRLERSGMKAAVALHCVVCRPASPIRKWWRVVANKPSNNDGGGAANKLGAAAAMARNCRLARAAPPICVRTTINSKRRTTTHLWHTTTTLLPHSPFRSPSPHHHETHICRHARSPLVRLAR